MTVETVAPSLSDFKETSEFVTDFAFLSDHVVCALEGIIKDPQEKVAFFKSSLSLIETIIEGRNLVENREFPPRSGAIKKYIWGLAVRRVIEREDPRGRDISQYLQDLKVTASALVEGREVGQAQCEEFGNFFRILCDLALNRRLWPFPGEKP